MDNTHFHATLVDGDIRPLNIEPTPKGRSKRLPSELGTYRFLHLQVREDEVGLVVGLSFYRDWQWRLLYAPDSNSSTSSASQKLGTFFSVPKPIPVTSTLGANASETKKGRFGFCKLVFFAVNGEGLVPLSIKEVLDTVFPPDALPDLVARGRLNRRIKLFFSDSCAGGVIPASALRDGRSDPRAADKYDGATLVSEGCTEMSYSLAQKVFPRHLLPHALAFSSLRLDVFKSGVAVAQPDDPRTGDWMNVPPSVQKCDMPDFGTRSDEQRRLRICKFAKQQLDDDKPLNWEVVLVLDGLAEKNGRKEELFNFLRREHLKNLKRKIRDELAPILREPVSAASIRKIIESWHIPGHDREPIGGSVPATSSTGTAGSSSSAPHTFHISALDVTAALRMLESGRTREAAVLAACMAYARVSSWLQRFHPLQLDHIFRPYGKPDFSGKLPADRIMIRINGGRMVAKKWFATKNPCKTLTSVQVYTSLSEEEAVNLFPEGLPNADNALIFPAKALGGRWVVDRHAGADTDGDDFPISDNAELISIIEPCDEQDDATLRELKRRLANLSTSSSMSTSSAAGVGSVLTDDALHEALLREIRRDMKCKELLAEVDRKWTYLADKFGSASPAAQSYGHFCELAVDSKLTRSHMSCALGDRKALREVDQGQWIKKMPLWHVMSKQSGQSTPNWQVASAIKNSFESDSSIARLFSETQQIRQNGIREFQERALRFFEGDGWASDVSTVQELWERIRS